MDKFYKPKKTTMIIAIIFFFTALLAVLWVRGIDKMASEHPDYNGNDLI
jgi:preprotein translocase subunit SecG